MHATAEALGLTAPTDLDELRREFQRIQTAASFAVGKSAWRVEVLRELERAGLCDATATPADWVGAAGRATVVCPKCQGTGEYRWGAVDLETGKTTHAAMCFQCEGSGRQDPDDFHRNKAYLFHSIRIAAGF
jgi:hypothetical protein